VAQRGEEEVGKDQDGVADSWPGDEGPLALPLRPFSVGLAGGSGRDWEQQQRHFEVMGGKAGPPNQPAKCFGFVQSSDIKAKRRLEVVLQSQGVQDSQPLTFLSDGGETVRNLPLLPSPQSEHLLDWVHLVRQEAVGVTVRHGASHDRTWCSITTRLGGFHAKPLHPGRESSWQQRLRDLRTRRPADKEALSEG
jgi:hypothetical protein